MPGMVKIGTTEDHPLIRLKTLSTLTSVPTEFTCAWYALVSDGRWSERRMHDALKGCRVAKNREFFRCTPGFARSAAESIGLYVQDAIEESTRSHTLGHSNGEWVAAITFLVLFFCFMPVWNSDIGLLWKPLIHFGIPIIGAFAAAIWADTQEWNDREKRRREEAERIEAEKSKQVDWSQLQAPSSYRPKSYDADWSKLSSKSGGRH